MRPEKGIHEENSRVALTAYAASVQTNQFKQWVAAILATLGAFSAGTCLAWTSPAEPLLKQAGKPSLNTEQISWIASLVAVGAFGGAIPAGLLANAIGRKRSIQVLTVPMFFSWMLIAFSGCVYGLYLARFLAGLVMGAYCVAIPMYVAELAEPKIRGTLGSLFQLQITAGILFENIVGITEDLKMIALLPSVVPVVFLAAFSFMPESPVYLSNKGYVNEARAALQWFRGATYDVEDELTKIQDQLRDAESNKAGITDLVKSKSASKAMIIALGLMVFQQLSGVNAVIFYTQNIFKDAGSEMSSYVPAIIVGSVMVVATYISTILIDRAGRRILLLLSCSVMVVCLACLAVYFYMQSHAGIKLPFAVPLLSIAVYITVFSLGFGPIPWIMLGELFSPKMKGLASSIAAAFNWILAFAVTKLFANMLDICGSGFTFALFAGVCVLGTIFVYFLVPETKGKDMEEIQCMLNGQDYQVRHVDSDIIIIDIKK